MNENGRRLTERIEKILSEMEKFPPESAEWVDLDEQFHNLIVQVKQPQKRSAYLRRYVEIGTDDPELVERSFKAILRSFRCEEIPDGPRFRITSYYESGKEEKT